VSLQFQIVENEGSVGLVIGTNDQFNLCVTGPSCSNTGTNTHTVQK